MDFRTSRRAIQILIAKGFIDRITAGTHPRYKLRPAHRVPGLLHYSLEPDSRAHDAFRRIEKGAAIEAEDSDTLQQLWEAGVVVRSRHNVLCSVMQSDSIWLPNAFVDGITGETPPLRRLRETGDAMALRLGVDLYSVHDLPNKGGVDPRCLHTVMELVHEAEVGAFGLWRFQETTPSIYPDHPIISPHIEPNAENDTASVFRRLDLMEKIGIIERYIPHVYDADGQLLFPLGSADEGEVGLEAEIGTAAHFAADRLLRSLPHYDAWRMRTWQYFPLLAHMKGLEVVGIARLRYRPQTSMTAAWYAQLQERGRKYVEIFERIGREDLAADQLRLFAGHSGRSSL
jgi:hypothetical protein